MPRRVQFRGMNTCTRRSRTGSRLNRRVTRDGDGGAVLYSLRRGIRSAGAKVNQASKVNDTEDAHQNFHHVFDFEEVSSD